MDKKQYTPPELTELGAIEDLTKGEGWDGRDDQYYCFRWGEDNHSG